MFVDACAIVAILSAEPGREDYDRALAQAENPFTSPLAAWEAAIVLARPEKFDAPFDVMARAVEDWLAERGIALKFPEASAADTLRAALEAAAKWKVGRRYLSSLDCFHYAHAKLANAPMLTRDVVLRQTDLKTLP
jgi:ribonuclease VapC